MWAEKKEESLVGCSVLHSVECWVLLLVSLMAQRKEALKAVQRGVMWVDSMACWTEDVKEQLRAGHSEVHLAAWTGAMWVGQMGASMAASSVLHSVERWVDKMDSLSAQLSVLSMVERWVVR